MTCFAHHLQVKPRIQRLNVTLVRSNDAGGDAQAIRVSPHGLSRLRDVPARLNLSGPSESAAF